ncbi:hypothetical protein [Pedobacter psychroterrae]|uniref:Uncharacterized protein n=1 Tax=Pedobacter psychroterrae TaxID=2530453 RepID=A0A4R0NER9_9SPHI|nr:hypothetical protein [Pedobacter psychroterrae]TCC98959.1 hypothetical protein EZ437_17635 [Pedobacter psychroterrae]
MKIKPTIALILLTTSLLTQGCDYSEDVAQEIKDTTFLDSRGKEYKFLGQIPDSLRTEQQNVTIKKLLQVHREYFKVENNRFVLKLSKQEFFTKGLSDYDYNVTLQEIDGNNKYVDEYGLDADSLNQEMIKTIDSSLKRPNIAFPNNAK